MHVYFCKKKKKLKNTMYIYNQKYDFYFIFERLDLMQFK